MEGGPPIFRQGFTCPALLVAHLVPQAIFRVRGYHPVSPDFPDRSTRSLAKECKAVSRSLAATEEISVDFFSSRYLDVSVPWVRLPSQKGRDTPKGGFPHSEIPGSKLVCQLPEAYRRLLRPSSPSTAKASTICAYSLDHITPKTLESHVLVITDTILWNLSIPMAPILQFLEKTTKVILRLKLLDQTKLLKSRLCNKYKVVSTTHSTGCFALADDWWSQGGSNSRPPACKAGALPAELWPRDNVFGGSGWI